MRSIRIVLAAYCATYLAEAGAVPITVSDSRNVVLGVWNDSTAANRYSDFVLHDSESLVVQFAKFDSSLGTLLNAQLLLTSTTSHPTKRLSLPEVSGLPVDLAFGAIAQDTERSLHSLFAFYDAAVSYRADYRLTIDPLNTDLFAPVAAEAAFGSCAKTEDLFLDIGNQNPHCTAGNNGSPLGSFSYSWGPLSGAALAQFIGADMLRFQSQIDGDAFGHCDDDDVGDYCRVNLAMDWNFNLSLAYTYEPGVAGPGPGTDPTPVPEPGTLGLMSIAFFGLAATRRRTVPARMR
jgi:hypothetical protein